MLWVPLIGVFLFTIGFWILSWLRKKAFVQVVEEEFALLGKFLRNRIRAFTTWLSPIRRLQKVRQIFVRNLPRSFRLWFCVKVVESETDPEVWTYMLKFLANKHLGISPQLPLIALGRELASVHGSDLRQMSALMQELDGSVYGSKPIDFTNWKQRFRKQLKPHLFRGRKATRKQTIQKLPPLNPDISRQGAASR